MYTKKQFGQELKRRVSLKQDVASIGSWAYSVYLEYICDIDHDLGEILIALNAMSDGPEFARSYEELDRIADDLIAEKSVQL